MSCLFADFSIELPGLCFAVWPKDDEICFNCTINEFEATIHLVRDSSGSSKDADDEHWTYVIDRALVKVARDEVDDPPPVVSDEKGQRDYTVQTEYFSQRTEAYGVVAREAINRFIRFFKFRLRTPFLQELPPRHHSLRNANWTSFSGKKVGRGPMVFVAKSAPAGLWGQLGVQKLKPEAVESVQAALADPIEPDLHEEILSDSQSALFENKLRRAVLELAIACELIVKRSFFPAIHLRGRHLTTLKTSPRSESRCSTCSIAQLRKHLTRVSVKIIIRITRISNTYSGVETKWLIGENYHSAMIVASKFMLTIQWWQAGGIRC
jgi:hypothetical protein